MAGRREVAVVGAGLMGSGIAQVAAVGGYDVVLHDVTDEALDRGVASIRHSFDRFVAKDRMAASDADAALARITTSTDLDACASSPLVVEAVYEDVDLKQETFRRLDAITAPGAVLATNTSAIPITRIASVVEDPTRVVGAHFFSPVPLMELCELVRGLRTSDATLAVVRRFAEDCGKTCVVVNRDVAGFVTTRLIVALTVEAARLVESGVATAEDVDTACRLGFGHAMGPLETADLTGIDVMAHAARNVYDETGDAKFLPPEIVARMLAAGRLGRKSGEGFYPYP